ncbi:SAM-dependent methyltransferase [Actinomadura rudentiformis]|uniref:SAM-dependent methyltransferase n=1 Tax=Actinomadura rudentiformis TaxID=359158 RepID=A0A6H9YI72_9ACTN|nr:SAM-dependent methyltransferase [Actinomadura rudentiformis]KAB2344907.1 SAM-dependent methyltransferase [Actinomadura rudentiformis]
MSSATVSTTGPVGSQIDTTRPHSARLWNYWLGGKDNYPVDREVGDKIVEIFPGIVDAARHSRTFMHRAVNFMASEAGIGQFLDIGVGLPTVDNTHEVVQRVRPDARIVYVDDDPLVMVHARALLTSTRQGACDYVHADLRIPSRILDAASGTLDFTKPIALLLLGILDHVIDGDEARAIIDTLVARLAEGSMVAIACVTDELHGELVHEAMGELKELGGPSIVARPAAELAHYFDCEGLELLEPGVVTCSRWRPDPNPFGDPEVSQLCGVARKIRP